MWSGLSQVEVSVWVVVHRLVAQGRSQGLSGAKRTSMLEKANGVRGRETCVQVGLTESQAGYTGRCVGRPVQAVSLGSMRDFQYGGQRSGC